MALHLTDDQKAKIRAALIALGPERRALLAGKCFAHKDRDFPYTDRDGYCALATMATTKFGPVRACADILIAAGVDTEGLYEILNLNDLGQLRTRAAVRELLSLAD